VGHIRLGTFANNYPMILDEDGHRLFYSTDQLVTESLTGRPIPLDPGKHHFRFVLPSGQTLTSDILVREGEKNRVVGVQVKGDGAPTAARASARTTGRLPPPAPAPTSTSLPTGFWIASTVSVASLASFGVFAVLGHNSQSSLDQCSPNCDASHRNDYDTMKRNYLIADLSLGAAAVSAGIAAWLFFSADSGDAPKRGAAGTARFAVVPLADRSGAAVLLTGSTF
jgi:hypothetical protein